MKLYNQEILKASEQAETIKLDRDFVKSIEIISKYPVLTQYIKLSTIYVDWFEDMIERTNDKELKMQRAKFIYESMGILQIFSIHGNVDRLKPLVKEFKKTLTQIFAEQK